MIDLHALLEVALANHGLPGAAVAVLHDGRIEEAAAGVANTRTGDAVTPDHIFNYGSVTKVLTATAVARLITEGRVELDAPISRYLPEFVAKDPRASGITVRQLMCHNSGLVGTIFTDTGKNADAVAKQIAMVAEQPLHHTPGGLVSYSNSAVIMLGRLLEVTTGKPWPAAFAEVLTGPLGLETVITTAEQAVRWRHVFGHVPSPAGGWVVEPVPFFIPGHSPAGSTPMGRARDLLAIAKLHLDRGRAPDGSQFLDPGLVAEMQVLQSQAATEHYFRGFGLGWMVLDIGGRRIVGHDGSTLGSSAFLRVDPERAFAVALVVNAPPGLLLYEQVIGAIFREVLGVWEPPPPRALPVDEQALAPYLGRYADIMLQQTLMVKDGRLLLETAVSPSNAFRAMPPKVFELSVSGPGQFFASGPDVMLFAIGKPKLTLWRPYAVFRADGDWFLQTSMLSFRRMPA